MENYAYDHATETSPVKRPAQIPAAFAELQEAFEVLHKSCAELESRLQPLLRNEPEATSNDQKDARPTLVQFASNIDGATRQVRAVIATHNSILRRLEL
jgi:hypothetical protein